MSNTPRLLASIALGLGLLGGGCGRFAQNEVMLLELGQDQAPSALVQCWGHAQRLGYPVVDGAPEQRWFRVAVPSTKYRSLFRVVQVDPDRIEIYAEGAHVRRGATYVHKRVKKELEEFAKQMRAAAEVVAVH